MFELSYIYIYIIYYIMYIYIYIHHIYIYIPHICVETKISTSLMVTSWRIIKSMESTHETNTKLSIIKIHHPLKPSEKNILNPKKTLNPFTHLHPKLSRPVLRNLVRYLRKHVLHHQDFVEGHAPAQVFGVLRPRRRPEIPWIPMVTHKTHHGGVHKWGYPHSWMV